MSRRYRHLTGFTLVEVLIVVVILGILAAIVVPHFSSGADDARNTSVREQLRVVRNAIELYKVEHGNQIPDVTANWDALTKTSAFSGKTVGPYLLLPPKNPLNEYTTVFDGPVTAPASGPPVGFIYDYSGGAGTGRLAATQPDGLTAYPE